MTVRARPNRIAKMVVTTGKGGVGKSTLSAATAVRAARFGHKTLVASTDPAHSLGDVFDRDLGSDPVTVAENLDAVHLDGAVEFTRSWSEMAAFCEDVLGIPPLHDFEVSDLLALPGLQEIFSLSRMEELAASGSWDAIIVDCAPSAESLRLLTLPEAVQWYVDRFIQGSGSFDRWIWRRVQRRMDLPQPGDEFINAVQLLCARLRSLRCRLLSPSSVVRLVATPQRAVLNESTRTASSLLLCGFHIDQVIINLAGERDRSWRQYVAELFGSAELLCVPRLDQEPIGIAQLGVLGSMLYGDLDPLEIGMQSPPDEGLSRDDEAPTLRIPLKLNDPSALRLQRDADELVVTAAGKRRRLMLPEKLRPLKVQHATYADGVLHVIFFEVNGHG